MYIGGGESVCAIGLGSLLQRQKLVTMTMRNKAPLDATVAVAVAFPVVGEKHIVVAAPHRCYCVVLGC